MAVHVSANSKRGHVVLLDSTVHIRSRVFGVLQLNPAKSVRPPSPEAPTKSFVRKLRHVFLSITKHALASSSARLKSAR